MHGDVIHEQQQHIEALREELKVVHREKAALQTRVNELYAELGAAVDELTRLKAKQQLDEVTDVR